MIIHTYHYGDGGLGDMLRSMFAYFVFCKKNDIEYKIFFDSNGPFESCFESSEGVEKVDYKFLNIGSKSTQETHNFLKVCKEHKDKNFLVRSNIFDFVSFDDLRLFKSEFLNFLKPTEAVKDRINDNRLENQNFSSIHIRCGDKFMSSVNIASDSRLDPSSEETIQLIDETIEFLDFDNVTIFTDNEYIKSKYPYRVNLLNSKIQHTALKTNYKFSYIDTVAEFFIMGLSEKIVSLSNSGFSFWSAFLHDKPLYKKVNGDFVIVDSLEY